MNSSPPAAHEPLLSVRHLTITFPCASGVVCAADDVSVDLERGETLGLVGESGSGKSVTALSILGLVPPPGRIARGEVVFEGHDLIAMGERQRQGLRGRKIALVPQEALTALNPVFTIGDQIAETLIIHGLAARAAARKAAVDLLAAVHLPDPGRRAHDYPHQLSGGMRQRALIAMALACRPALVIADEPTTALDVTLQAEILELLRDLRQTFALSLLLITHDLAVVAGVADRVAVMYAGRIVEIGPTREIFRSPLHPYTRGLLQSVPGSARRRRLAAIEGAVPELSALPPGCPFAPRCSERFDRCERSVPPLVSGPAGRQVRCVLHSRKVS